jgi:[acyl-carrier-protein] S-malonyltransferase
LALKTPDDLPAALEMVEKHGSDNPMDASPSWRMLVAPAKGTFRRGGIGEGEDLDPGTTIGTLVTLRDEQPVAAPHGGTVLEWLVEDGDPVAPGQPLVRLYPREGTP